MKLEYSLIATIKNYQASRSSACVIRPPPGEVGIVYVQGRAKIGNVYILETKTKVTGEAITTTSNIISIVT